eukprot:Blabericola_migrator_1__2494@NODE_1700_length_3976_cov_130_475058_g1100_i0_p2_GENE_NODE_1700_length_3976_cov_130_475058_g1100_i0NODE_1700_length_3976_cov_130_475058_g1100_i0_p2_ORF_typecomplete_len152_score11_77_NODE_1700_length_3976_cov_130_475058_g1100_i034003855
MSYTSSLPIAMLDPGVQAVLRIIKRYRTKSDLDALGKEVKTAFVEHYTYIARRAASRGLNYPLTSIKRDLEKAIKAAVVKGDWLAVQASARGVHFVRDHPFLRDKCKGTRDDHKTRAESETGSRLTYTQPLTSRLQIFFKCYQVSLCTKPR